MLFRSGETISADSTLSAEQSLQTDSKMISIGCVDPNKSLYMGNFTPNTLMKKAEEFKGDNTIEFLKKLNSESQENPSPFSNKPKVKSNYQETPMVNIIHEQANNSAGSSLNSMKLHDINRRNDQRFEDLYGYNKEISNDDSFGRLDDKLINSIRNNKELHTEQALNSIPENEMEESADKSLGSNSNSKPDEHQYPMWKINT